MIGRAAVKKRTISSVRMEVNSLKLWNMVKDAEVNTRYVSLPWRHL